MVHGKRLWNTCLVVTNLKNNLFKIRIKYEKISSNEMKGNLWKKYLISRSTGQNYARKMNATGASAEKVSCHTGKQIDFDDCEAEKIHGGSDSLQKPAPFFEVRFCNLSLPLWSP